MKEKEKDLLIQDLCARLPYGFTIHRHSDNANIKINDIDEFAHFLEYSDGEEFKPYLRPMSSMTEYEITQFEIINFGPIGFNWRLLVSTSSKLVDWLNSHHFDYRGLIEKGLAFEAPEEMYKI